MLLFHFSWDHLEAITLTNEFLVDCFALDVCARVRVCVDVLGSVLVFFSLRCWLALCTISYLIL